MLIKKHDALVEAHKELQVEHDTLTTEYANLKSTVISLPVHGGQQ
jgi:hypothetical protein